MNSNNITVSKSKLNKMIAAGVAAALATLATNAPATAPIAAEPVKRGPGRPRKDQTQGNTVQGAKVQGPKGQGAKVQPSNVVPITEAKRRGREPVVGPLMHNAMLDIFKKKGGTEVTFEELKTELDARAFRKVNPDPTIPDATIRNYLTKMEGELWDRVSYGKYIPRKVA